MDNDRHIIIYNDHGHVRIKLQAGEYLLPISTSTDISSICVFNDNLEAIPCRLIDGEQSNNRKDNILATVMKNGVEYTGIIMNVSDSQVTIKDNFDIYTIRNYDTISTQSMYDSINSSIKVELSEPATCSYIINNIRWKCVGTVLIDTETKELYWRLAGIITNDTDLDIEGHVYLLSGDINQSGNMILPKARSSTALIANSFNNSDIKGLVEDNVSYDVGTRNIVVTDIAEIGSYVFGSEKIYIYDIHNDTVKYGYIFESNDYIPACNITIYTTNNGQIGPHIGSDYISETQAGKEVKIILGSSTKVGGKTIYSTERTKITESEAKSYGVTDIINVEYYIATTKLDMELKNYNETSVMTRIQHYVGYAPILSCDLQPYVRREQEYMEWTVILDPAQGDQPSITKLTTTIVTGSP